MPGALTELTEIVTGLGVLAPTLDQALATRPARLKYVDADVWERLRESYATGTNAARRCI